MEFIESGGYQKFQFWLDEGWSWVEKNEINSPEYWRKINGKWHVYTLGGLVEVDPSAILAHVSFYEANAYATWKGMRLPTEFEWEVAADSLDWGERWEWTSSSYSPYPNFKIAAGALGEYNGKFMVNQMVLRGGSVATSEGHSRKTYRNFFHPHFQWQYSGIRLCR
jgi:ergothioneine biosynthesis protein EgtB